MAVFQKFSILIIKEEFPFIWEFGNGRKYQKLTKTDKSLDVKGKNCKHKRCKKEKNCKCIIVEVCKYDFFLFVYIM